MKHKRSSLIHRKKPNRMSPWTRAVLQIALSLHILRHRPTHCTLLCLDYQHQWSCPSADPRIVPVASSARMLLLLGCAVLTRPCSLIFSTLLRRPAKRLRGSMQSIWRLLQPSASLLSRESPFQSLFRLQQTLRLLSKVVASNSHFDNDIISRHADRHSLEQTPSSTRSIKSSSNLEVYSVS